MLCVNEFGSAVAVIRPGLTGHVRRRAGTTFLLYDEDTNAPSESYAHLQDGMKLREEVGLDSVDVVSIVSQIERHFRIRLAHQELEKLVTVGDVLGLLEAKLAEQAQAAA